MHDLKGGCYCGAVHLSFKTASKGPLLIPRACQCDFCQAHGAEWLSEASASLEITIENKSLVHTVIQGSKNARFWLCQNCGVLMAVTCIIDGTEKAAVNRRALEQRDIFPTAIKADPQGLDGAAKKQRWDALWIQSVVINGR